jgi:hypothetical protein
MVASQQISEKYGCFATKMMKSMVAAQQSVCETNKQSVDVSFFINVVFSNITLIGLKELNQINFLKSVWIEEK